MTARTVVRRLFAAVEARDPAPLLELYSPEVVIHEAPCLPYGGDHRGHAGMMRHASAYTHTWDRLQEVADRRMDARIVAAGGDVLVAWRQRAHGAGGALDMPMVSRYRVEGVHIVAARMLAFDTVALLAFLDEQRVEPAVGPRGA